MLMEKVGVLAALFVFLEIFTWRNPTLTVAVLIFCLPIFVKMTATDKPLWGLIAILGFPLTIIAILVVIMESIFNIFTV